jgi:hypothetical protein
MIVAAFLGSLLAGLKLRFMPSDFPGLPNHVLGLRLYRFCERSLSSLVIFG